MHARDCDFDLRREQAPRADLTKCHQPGRGRLASAGPQQRKQGSYFQDGWAGLVDKGQNRPTSGSPHGRPPDRRTGPRARYGSGARPNRADLWGPGEGSRGGARTEPPVWLRRRQTWCSRACTFVSRAGGRRRVVGGGRSSSSTGRRRLGLGASRGMRAVRTARTSTSLRAPIATTKWCAVCGSGPRSVRCCDG